MSDIAAAPLPSSVVDQAIAWAVKLNFSQADTCTREAFERWRQAAPEHERAWSRMQALNADFASVPQGLALDALMAMDHSRAHAARRQQRRAVLKGLAVAGGLLGSGWVVREQTPWQRLAADVSTSVGQRDPLTLADGTRLVLNTDSAVSLSLDGSQRIVTLHRGEISIQTGADAAFAVKRPFFVRTSFGSIEALGTRFVVRLENRGARVSVQEDAVELRPADSAVQSIARAGEQWVLDRQKVRQVIAPAMDSGAWVEGAIAGKNMRLADVLAEMSRYRHGRITCAPEVADLRVSGTYHLNDIDQALQFLAQTTPIRVRYWTRFWVSVGPA